MFHILGEQSRQYETRDTRRKECERTKVNKMTMTKTLGAIVLAAATLGCAQHRTEYDPEQIAPGTITVEHVLQRTVIIPAGKALIPVTYPERYDVHVTAADCSSTIDDKTLFDHFKDGARVDVAYRHMNDVAYRTETNGEHVLRREYLGCAVTRIGDVMIQKR